SPNARLVPQCPNPHLRRLPMSGDMLHHIIRWNVHLSAILLRTELAAVDRKHLHLAHAPLTRSTKKWASAHGPSDEADHDGTGVVVCRSAARRQPQAPGSCRRTAHTAP